MSTLTVRPRPISHFATRPAVALALALLTAALTAAGLATPWLTLFNGLSPVRGASLDGGYLAAVTTISLATLFVLTTRGGGNILRCVASLGGVVVVADSLVSAARISAYVAHPGVTAALTAPTAGPGPFITLFSGIALICTAVAAPATGGRLGKTMLLRLLLSASLIVAADIHLVLTPQHFDESPLLGGGFLAAGLCQLVLAAYVVTREDDRPIGFLIAITISLIAIYLYAVVIGLPLDSEHSDGAVGLRLGSGEPVTLTGLTNVLVEIAAIPLALIAYAKRSRPLPAS